MVVDIRQRIGEDLYILFEEDKRKYDISAFDSLVGKYVFTTSEESTTLTTEVTDSQYIYLEENGNNYIEFVIGFPVNDFYSFKILDVQDDFDRATTITTMGDINPTTLNAEFDNIKEFILLMQEIMSKKMLKYDAEFDTAMIPKLKLGEGWTLGEDGIIATDFQSLSYDDSAIQSEVDLNTAKTTDLVHPLVEKSVPSNAVFTDTLYDDSGLQTEIDINSAKVTDLVHPLVSKAVPSNAVFTDTVFDDSDVLKDSDTVSPVTPINKLITESDIGIGTGDMTKAVYDTNDDGIVDLTLDQARLQGNTLTGHINFDGNDIINVDSLLFENGENINWNDKYHTMNVPTGDGSKIKVGIDTMFEIHNATGTTLTKGTVVYPTGTSTGGISNVDRAIARTHETLETVLGLVAEDINNGTNGHVLIQGIIDPINTLGLSEGAVYLSGDVAGTLTNDKPDWTKFTVLVGIVDSVSATGVITVDIAFNIQDTITNFFNGIFRESFDLLVTSNSVTITATLTPSDDNSDMTMIFNKGMFLLDTSPEATIELIEGTNEIPQTNYIYIPSSTKVLTVSTTGFPPTAEHIKVGTVVVQTALTVFLTGALGNHNYNDHVQSVTGQGHMSHITERIRVMDAIWESGTEATVTGLPTNALVSVTGGIVYQLHRQDFPSLSMPTNDISIVNDFASAYSTTSNLLSILNDALGNSLNNTSFSIVVWGISNKTGEPSHLMANLPTGTYSFTSPDDAVIDTQGYSVYAIPRQFRGTGFLIARFTFVNQSGTWSLYDTDDLRGKFANTSAGGSVGGGGGSGVTTLLALTDTPSTYASNSLKMARVNNGETALEFVELDASLVTDFDTEVANNTAVTLNTAKVSNLSHPLVETAVPIGALFTDEDTIYDDSDVLKDSDTVSPVTGINKLMTQDDVSGLGGGDMLKSVYDTDNNGIVDDSDLTNGFLVETAVPSGALFTDTLYDDTDIQNEVDLNTAKVTDLVHPVVNEIVPVGALFTDTVYDDVALQAQVTINNAKVTDLVHPLVEKAVPSNALFSDTTYTIQDGELSEINFTSTKDTKLANIDEDANDYTHPVNHSPSIITQDITNRFVTDAEKTTWNNKADPNHNHAIADVTNLQTSLNAKMTITTYDSTGNGIVDNAEEVNGLTVETAVPSSALFTDTIYDDSDVLKDADSLSPVTGINKLMTEDDVTGLGALPSGGATDQVLTKLSGTDFDTDWVDASGGGGDITTVPLEYCRAKSSTNQNLNSTGNTDIVFNNADINSDALKFTVVSGGIQVLQSGRYKVKLQHSLDSSSTQRADPLLEIIVNGTGTGYLSREHYARNTSGIDHSTSQVDVILDLNTNDTIGMRLTRGNIDLSGVSTFSGETWIEVTEHHGVKGEKGDEGIQGEDGQDGSGFIEAPQDGKTYGRKDASWSTTLPTQSNLVEIIVLTQSQYDALGSATDTDNIEYHIRG